MNPENRGYYLRNRDLAQPPKENGDTVLNREKLPTVEQQPLAVPPPPTTAPPSEPPTTPPPPPTVEPVDPALTPGPDVDPAMMMHPTGLQLEKFAGDDQLDAKSWLQWFERYCTVHKQDEGQQLLTLPFYLTSHARIWYDSLEDATKTDLKQLKDALGARFTKQDILDTELLDITQRPEENCNDYFTRVLKKAQHNNADKSLVSSLAIKGLRPAIKQIVMPMNPLSFDEARQRAILAEKTVHATTPPVAAYIHPSANDSRIDELTKMVQNLKVKLDNQSPQPQNQQQQQSPSRRGGRRRQWRGPPQHRDWRQPPAWQQQPSWNQQPAAQYWQQQPHQGQQGPQRYEELNQRTQQPCPGCKGEDLNCNFPAYCSSQRAYCNKCRQRGHFVNACPNNR